MALKANEYTTNRFTVDCAMIMITAESDRVPTTRHIVMMLREWSEHSL